MRKKYEKGIRLRNNWLGMIDDRTRMTGVAHDDGERICLVAANEDGVSFRSTLTRASNPDTPYVNHYVHAYGQG